MDDFKVLYLCDKKACNGSCPNNDCHHTYDIKHAVNFETQVDPLFAVVGDRTYFVEQGVNKKHDEDEIVVGTLDVYTIGLNDEDLRKIAAGEEIVLNTNVEGEDQVVRGVSICIKKEAVAEE